MDNVNLERYIEAHKIEYKQALEEIKSGKKENTLDVVYISANRWIRNK